MATKSTGLFLIPDIPGGAIILRVDLRNYGSRSHQVTITVNRFLSNGRKSRVSCRNITVSIGAANFFQVDNLKGATVEVLVQGSQTVRPSVTVLQEQRHDGSAVLLQILPRMFSTL